MTRVLSHLRSNAVAYLALVVAMGGTSYAAATLPKNSVGAQQIQTNAVRGAEVKDGSLASADFRAGELPAGPQGPKGNTGTQGIQGVPGADALSVVVPTVRVLLSAPINLADNSVAQIPFDTEVYDPAGMHDAVNPTRLTAPIAGVYFVSATVYWTQDADGSRGVEIQKGGVLGDAVAISNISAANAMPTEQNLSGEIRLAAGEFVTVRGEVAAAGNPLQLFGFAQPLTFATMSFVSP